MIYKCLECGHVFEEGEEARWEEPRGEYWGSPCSQEMSGCPVCKGDYEEAKTCKECGEVFFADELDDGLCENCRDLDI